MASEQATVEYREHPGHPGYRVGTDGSVWSCWYCVSNGQSKGTRREMGDKWYRMKGWRDSLGYMVVCIRNRGHTRVHSLVLETFVGPRPPGMCCRHFPDSNKTNNQLSNLSWGTHQQNHGHDREAHGTSNKGERNGMHKLTEEDVRKIRNRHQELRDGKRRVPKWALDALRKEFGVSEQCILDITNGRTWKHVA